MSTTKNGAQQPSTTDQIRALYEQAESDSAQAFDQLAATPSFGRLLALGAASRPANRPDRSGSA